MLSGEGAVNAIGVEEDAEQTAHRQEDATWSLRTRTWRIRDPVFFEGVAGSITISFHPPFPEVCDSPDQRLPCFDSEDL